MTNKVLYNLYIPTDTMNSNTRNAGRNISKHGVVGTGDPSTVDISTNPDEKRIVGSYRGKFAKKMTEQLEGLFSADAIKTVAFYSLDPENDSFTQDRDNGYYALESVSAGPADERDTVRGMYEWEGRITLKGTRKTAWRSVSLKPADISGDNPYSSAGTTYVYVPSTATKVRWFNDIDGSRESASGGSAVSGEFIDMVPYDVSEPSFDDPTLIYDIPYEDEAKADSKVWDDHGRNKKETHEGKTVNNTWERVFDTAHTFDGKAYVETGILRLVFDEPNNTMTAYTWDDANSTYSQVTLNASDWQLFDLDLTRIGDDRVVSQIEFENTSSGDLYAIDLDAKRGWDKAVITQPQNEANSVPSGLQNKLDPIASTTETDPVAEKDVVKREDTRR